MSNREDITEAVEILCQFRDGVIASLKKNSSSDDEAFTEFARVCDGIGQVLNNENLALSLAALATLLIIGLKEGVSIDDEKHNTMKN